MEDIKDTEVVRLNAVDGDTIVVTMPEKSAALPENEYDLYAARIANAFNELFHDKDVRVLIVPHGSKVEMFPAEWFKDKE